MHKYVAFRMESYSFEVDAFSTSKGCSFCITLILSCQEGGKMGHLTYDDRLSIQKYLKEGLDFAEIGRLLCKDRSTILREVKTHRMLKYSRTANRCIYRRSCNIRQRCKESCIVRSSCITCPKCNISCEKFVEEKCKKLSKPPYVCNDCTKQYCFEKWIYDAKVAQEEYEICKRESRKGISLSDSELNYLEKNIIPLVKKGVSVSVACAKNADKMPVSSRTVYSYIHAGIFDISNTELRLSVRRPMRKKTGPTLRVDHQCHVGRSYHNYQEYIAEHPAALVCQMDTVLGRKGGKVLLSLLFTSCDLQLFYLRDANTAATVTDIFCYLRQILGDDFSKLFQVILTDRGSEFTNPKAIECNKETGEIECNIFYCDPMQSNQKSNCERNHEIFRYISPKGKSFDHCTQDDILLIMNHINSYPRQKLNWKTPMEVFEELYGTEVLKKLGLEKIELSKLQLRESLLQK